MVEMSSGFHVIRLVERQEAGLQRLDEKTQKEIKKKLQNIIMEREYRRLVDNLKQKAAVRIVESE